jgi:type II secretory pathway pseudopilin PulG
VIVILGILLALAVPALTGYIGKGKNVKKEADLNTSAKAIQTWAVERFANGLIGHNTLVIPDSTDPLENTSNPLDPASYSGTTDGDTWEGIVATLSKLDLRGTSWRLVNISFDDRNKLLSLRIINSQDLLDFADYGAPPVPTPPLPAYTLSYSEGAVMLGSATGSGGFTGLASTSYTINLTSPIGWPTVRYFSTSDASATWSLDAGTTGATLASSSGANTSVSIPVGATGTATLTSDAYTITFDVAASRPPSTTLKRGDTFAASGFDWRILYKASNTDALVISEHTIDIQPMNSIRTSWDTNIRWDGSDLRAALNNNTYAYSYDNLTDINTKILDTTLYTRIGFSDARIAPYKTGGASDSGHNGYKELTNQKLFLLSEEEVFRTIEYSYGGTTDVASMDLTQNLYGSSVVLFADANARKTSGTDSWYWLRSPRYSTFRAALVVASTSAVGNYLVDFTYGVRPAFRMDLS